MRVEQRVAGVPAGEAIAFTVKSRRARSASIRSPRIRTTSTCHSPPASRARQVANSSESWKTGPRRRVRSTGAQCPLIAGHREVYVPRPPCRAEHRGWRRPRSMRPGAHRAPPGTPAPQERPRAALRSARSPAAAADVQTRNPGRDAAGDLVVDRPQAARRPPRRGSARLPAPRSGPPASPGRRSVSGPRSTVTLSMDTVPTIGWRRPPTSTSALLVSPRRTPSP